MPPPAQVSCSKTDCDFVTPEGTPTWELLNSFLTNHTNSCHPAPVAAPQGAGQPSSKLEKLPRPVFTLGMSESAWEFVMVQWNAYIGQGTVSAAQSLQQLQAACSADLLQRVYDTGSYSTLTTTALFLAAMEKLAVLKVHKAVHTMNMWRMTQQSDETIRAFAARITGTAELCGMTLECTSCQTVNSFRDKVVLQVMLHGMRDNEIRSKVMSRNTTGDLIGLHKTVDFIEAEEAGSQEASDIHEHSQVNAIRRSTYQKLRSEEQKKQCGYCGGSKHGATNSSAERQKSCRAWGKTCQKCQKTNHLASVCRSKPTKNPADEKDSASVDFIAAGGFFSITATLPAASSSLPPTPSSLPRPSTWPPSWTAQWAATPPWHPPCTGGSWSFSSEPAPAIAPRYPIPCRNRFSIWEDAEEIGEDDLMKDSMETPTPPTSSSTTPSRRAPAPCRRRARSRSPSLVGPQHRRSRKDPPSSVADLLPIIASMTEKDASSFINTIPLPHHVHSHIHGWLQTKPDLSPTHPMEVTLDRQAYAELCVPLPKLYHNRHRPGRHRNNPTIMDTGAQLTVGPIQLLHHLGVKRETIFPIAMGVNGASKAPLTVEGAILLRFSGTNPTTGQTLHTRQLVYISSSVDQVYLSKAACIDLGMIPANFPAIGSCTADTQPSQAIAAGISVPGKCSNDGVLGPDDTPCSCPIRSAPPSDPPVLPCSPIPENLPIIKQYLLDRYAASAFNVCERQPLPLMKNSPPLRLFVDEGAKPTAVGAAGQIPAHWVHDVKAGIERDVALGVIEPVPVNTPDTWTSRMVITAKHDGSPRRVVDFQPVNQHAPRQTHHTPSAWNIVSSIPAGKVKSVVDCFHGYHSVPIHPADRHFTTFLTPWGRFRYKTSPQGFLSAGDGYSQRMDEIIGDFSDYQKCIDDSIIWDDSIEDNFNRVCEFLERCNNGGCIFNPQKFQFGSREVDFLGFRITDTGIKPSSSFMDNILSFPSPQSLTDVRSWFGMINQISYTFAQAPVMLPFRHLLSSKVPFMWSEDLEKAFQESKLEIIKQCEKGVRSFTPFRPTALATDWSRKGMGFWLCQKFCECEGAPRPGCCPTGWQTIFCGSRFCTAAESRYHPIEGEALAAAYGLEKCRFFVLGLPDLILCLDHRPLLSLFGKQELATIHNPRLFNYKTKSLPYRFQPIYVPGKEHVTPDALSRRHDGQPDHQPDAGQIYQPDAGQVHQPDQDQLAGQVQSSYAESLSPPTWVTSPTLLSCILTVQPTEEEMERSTELEELLTGTAMASLAALNHGPYYTNGNHSCSLCAVTHSDIAILSWERLEAACRSSPVYQLLHNTISGGVPDDISDWDDQIKPYHKHRHALVVSGPVVLLYDRPVIPHSLRQEVVEHLHSGHAGVTTMFERAQSTLYWPGYKADLTKHRAACRICDQIAPSNPAQPPSFPEQPLYPFHSVCTDFFTIHSRNYLAFCDRYSGWLSVFKLAKDDSANIIKVLRDYCCTFGIPAILSSDGASVFTSDQLRVFCQNWGIFQRISSAYHPTSNKRAEVGVKSAKRLVRDNLHTNGSLDNDRFARALLTHRNNPCPTSGLSPAQIIFGRVLRDFLPIQPGKFAPRPEWRLAADQRAAAFAKRHVLKHEQLHHGARHLPPLVLSEHVAIQDQTGKTPRAWTKTGTILEVLPHHSYLVRVDGSNRVTKRNRQFLRSIRPFSPPLFPAEPMLPAPALTPDTSTRPVTACPVDPTNPTLVPDTVAATSTVPDDVTSTNDVVVPIPTPKPKPVLPAHLRHRWIVAKK